MTYKFTTRAKKALEIANDISLELGHNYIATEHILYGLAKEGAGIATKVLENQDLTPEKIEQKIEELIGREKSQSKSLGFTPRTKRVIENAFNEARKLGYDYIGTEHLLIGILREADSAATRILFELNVNIHKLYNEIAKVVDNVEDTGMLGEIGGNMKNNKKISQGKGSYNSTQTLNQFGEDLSIKAEDGKLDPVIGRKKEIDRVIQILSRRTKNNPCLVGEPGVGKTAIVEGLAQQIVARRSSRNIEEKKSCSFRYFRNGCRE